MLRSVAKCCSVLWCFALGCSGLQCDVMCSGVLQRVAAARYQYEMATISRRLKITSLLCRI